MQGGGEAKAGSQRGPKKKKKTKKEGVQLPTFPGGWEEAGKRRAGWERGGSGGQEGGTPAASPTPFALCALGEIKNSCVQRVAASATKSVLSGGSCKLFAAPGNQHLGLQSPSGPPSPFLPCQKLPLPFSNPHMSCQQSMNAGSLPGEKRGNAL